MLFLLFFMSTATGLAQEQQATIRGTIQDSSGQVFPNVEITVEGLRIGTTANDKGRYSLEVPANRSLQVNFSYLNSVQKTFTTPPLDPGETYPIDIVLPSTLNLKRVEIQEDQDLNKTNLEKIDPKNLETLPSASGDGVQNLIKTLPGVSSTNGLSSSLSVRGGNYDENMVYINDVEIYRPFLVNSGRQEGLSIVNSDMVGSINFSAGGFEARYGDKMSSVLDITYKRPDSFGGSATASLLGGDFHIEGSSDNHRFTYLLGGRYRNQQYLLNSLDVEGDYRPVYGDFQSFLTYDISSDLEVSLLTHYGNNRYLLNPSSRETDFGTPSQVLRLKIFFEGQEEMQYENLLNALTFRYKPSPRTTLKFISSVYNTDEEENFDILGQYRLSEIETNPSSDNFQEPKANLGIGSFLDHARNELTATIYSAQHKGTHIWSEKDHELKWGLRYQHEDIQDKLKEWRYLDSSGYSVPRENPNKIQLDRFTSNEFNLANNRFTGYVQNTFTLDDTSNAYLTAGVRGHYWDFNDELVVSPRFQFTFEPNRKHNRKEILQNPDSPDLRNNLTLKASGGFYQQPPFYREFRNRQGELNYGIQSQKSYHLVLGSELVFELWDRPFKWSSEVYFKYMEDLIPYDIEDVRIRYFAENVARGYAVGWDNKLYGEFIPGLPSWASLSIMETREDLDEEALGLEEDQGFIRRPLDQRVQVGLYFQDFLPRFPDYKVFVNLVYGSNLPLNQPGSIENRNVLQTDPYNRVDLGFSRLIEPKKGFLKFSNKIWISLEVLNLFNTQNTISYFWIRDTRGRQFAVPNNSTGRRINLKLRMNF